MYNIKRIKVKRGFSPSLPINWVMKAGRAPPPGYPRHQACFNPGQDFYFFSFLEPIMDVFKAFPMINYKSECPMYSFTSENV